MLNYAACFYGRYGNYQEARTNLTSLGLNIYDVPSSYISNLFKFPPHIPENKNVPRTHQAT